MKKPPIVPVPECTCPACKHRLTAATAIASDRGVPKEGDLTMCAYCTAFLVFKDDSTVRVMTLEEVGNLQDEERMLLVELRRRLKAE